MECYLEEKFINQQRHHPAAPDITQSQYSSARANIWKHSNTSRDKYIRLQK